MTAQQVHSAEPQTPSASEEQDAQMTASQSPASHHTLLSPLTPSTVPQAATPPHDDPSWELASDAGSVYLPPELVSQGGSLYMPPTTVEDTLSAGCQSSESDILGSAGSIVSETEWEWEDSEEEL